MYSKCGRIAEAASVFATMPGKNLISWNAMIAAYNLTGKSMKALGVFRKMREDGQLPDEFTLTSALKACTKLGAAKQGRQIHGFSHKIPSGLRISVCNSALDMYLKCGMIEDAEKLLSEMPARDVVSWTVMITGYGKHGLGKEAVHLFNRMVSQNIKPDEVTYLAILLACSHSGLVEEGEQYLSKLCSDESVKPRVEHYACMVDLLGRAGRLKEAKNLICTMPVEPNAGIWQTLLSACRVHGDIDMGREVGNIILRMDGNNPVNYVMLSNMLANAGYWEESQTLRETVTSKKLKKEAGRSWVEIDKEIHSFYGGDDTHPLAGEIRQVLDGMGRRMKQELGYVNEVKHELHDIDEESKQESLRLHSEKLAIGLALVCGGWEKGRVIRVFKNLRVCVDCHEFIKGLSRILQVVFVVRDANRFHRFENGLCSCRDYW
ncbi:Putative pentatricopeptide repeat-containing protein At3g15130 [Linum perenne]